MTTHSFDSGIYFCLYLLYSLAVRIVRSTLKGTDMVARDVDPNDVHAQRLVLLSTLAKLAGWRHGMGAEIIQPFEPASLVAEQSLRTTLAKRLMYFGLVDVSNGRIALNQLAWSQWGILIMHGFAQRIRGDIYRIMPAGVMAMEMAAVCPDELV